MDEERILQIVGWRGALTWIILAHQDEIRGGYPMDDGSWQPQLPLEEENE